MVKFPPQEDDKADISSVSTTGPDWAQGHFEPNFSSNISSKTIVGYSDIPEFVSARLRLAWWLMMNFVRQYQPWRELCLS